MPRARRALRVALVAFAVGTLVPPETATASSTKKIGSVDLDCDDSSYQKSTLTLLSSSKFAAIPGFLRSGHMRQFEGSGVSVGPTGQVAVVFDNSHALGILGGPSSSSSPASPLSIGEGELVGDRGGSQSGWEGVAWRHDNPGGPATVLALREAVEVPKGAVAFEAEKEKEGGQGSLDENFGWGPRGLSPTPRGNASDVEERERKRDKKEKKKQKKQKRKARLEGDGNALFAVVDELALPTVAGEPPKLLRSCPVDFELTHDNKGLEDLYYLGNGRAIALCEGNYCEGGKRGREEGNGRLLVLRYDDGSEEEEEKEKKSLRRRLLSRPPSHKRRGSHVFVGGQRAADAAATARGASGGGGAPRPVAAGASSSSSPPLFAARCAWRVESVVDLPRDAAFEDYSGLALRSGLVAVLSQRDSAVFVAGFDVETLKFDPVPEDRRYSRRVFGLPRSNTCQEHSFCTAEGIDLLDDPLVRGVVRVLVATDKAAAGSPWACVHTAEAVHVMSLPKHALPQAPDGEEEEED